MKRTLIRVAIVALCAASAVRADQKIESVQQALKDQGFYYGDVTGNKTADTTAAIRRYQIRNGLQVTGEVNPETLRSLNLNSASSTQATTKSAVTQPSDVRPDKSARLGQTSLPPAPSGHDRRLKTNAGFPRVPYPLASPRRSKRIVLAEVQRQLAGRGYYRGRIDGRYGRRTALALRAFQLDGGIPPSGWPNPETLGALGLSDWNLAYLNSASWPGGMRMPEKTFKHGNWEEYYRGDDADEYDNDDLYGTWEGAEKEFEPGKWEEEQRKNWEDGKNWNEKRQKKWKKWKKHHGKGHEDAEKQGEGHGHDD
ncbi:MAG TPA: peptidoglycan-binding domain-containing protein [Candidatus Udaeobacter sp.]|nr:peptidoglycan-binding domain-containing protein [Candidatus Udaeobacter sp.]